MLCIDTKDVMILNLKLCFDIDDIIVDTVPSVIDYLNRKANLNLRVCDIVGYPIEQFVPDEYKYLVGQAFEDKEMWKTVQLIPDAVYYLELLSREDYDIYFATATTTSNIFKKHSHLKRNLPFIDSQRKLINIKNKQLLNVDIMVDDSLHNLTGERSYWSICLDKPWNQIDDEIPRFSRVYNWKEIYEQIHLIDNFIMENR